MTKKIQLLLRLEPRLINLLTETGEKLYKNKQGAIEHIIREYYYPKQTLS